jgi:hypothetical protein
LRLNFKQAVSVPHDLTALLSIYFHITLTALLVLYQVYF